MAMNVCELPEAAKVLVSCVLLVSCQWLNTQEEKLFVSTEYVAPLVRRNVAGE
jgi:hypothetical protein